MTTFAPLGDSVSVTVTDTDQRVTLPSVPTLNPVIRLVVRQANMQAWYLKLGNVTVTGSKTTSMRVRPGDVDEPLYLPISNGETHLSIFCEGPPGTVILTAGRVMDDGSVGSTTGGAGPTGATGPAGPAGSRGRQGAPFPNEEGDQGERGPPGPRGRSGNTGSTGPAGARGFRGGPGADGDDGDIGVPGRRGVTGPQGIQGPAGSRRAYIIEGADGDDGSIGLRGKPGAAGAAGARGFRGFRGASGEDGEDGVIGPPGRRPLVTIGGGCGSATIDFGAFPGKSDTSIAITGQTGIVAGSVVDAWLFPLATADHSADEHLVESINVRCGNIVPGVGFTIYALNSSEINEPPHDTASFQVRGSAGTRIYGQWNVGWSWSSAGSLGGGPADDSITNAKLANMVQSTIKGRARNAGTGDPTDLTPLQVRSILDLEFNVKDFGAIGNGIANDAPAIQSAVNQAIAAGGGRVFLPAGTYLVSSAVTVGSSTVHISGEGRNVTFVNTSSATLDVFAFNGTCFDSSIQKMTVGSTAVTPTAGAGVATSNGVGVITIYDLRIQNTFNGVSTINTGVTGVVKVLDCDISTIFNDSMLVSSVSQFFGVNVNTFQNAGRRGNAGLHIIEAGAFYLVNVNLAGNNTGFLMDPTTGHSIYDGLISTMEIDSCGTHGMVLDTGGGGKIYNMVFTNIRSGTCVKKGYIFAGSNTSNICLTNFSAVGNGEEGVNVNAIKDSQFINGQVLSNAVFSAGLSGIHVLTCDGLIISGVKSGIWPQLANNQGQGLLVESTVVAPLIVDNCDMRGNTTAVSNLSTSNKVRITNVQGYNLDWQIIPKKNFESRASTTTLANDTDLKFDMDANTSYQIRMVVYFQAGATGDFKYALTGPAAPNSVGVLRKHIDPSALTTLVTTSEANYTASTALAAGAGTSGGYIEFEIRVRNGVNAGTFAFQWAQNTSDVTASIVLEGSYLEYRAT